MFALHSRISNFDFLKSFYCFSEALFSILLLSILSTWGMEVNGILMLPRGVFSFIETFTSQRHKDYIDLFKIQIVLRELECNLAVKYNIFFWKLNTAYCNSTSKPSCFLFSFAINKCKNTSSQGEGHSPMNSACQLMERFFLIEIKGGRRRHDCSNTSIIYFSLQILLVHFINVCMIRFNSSVLHLDFFEFFLSLTR